MSVLVKQPCTPGCYSCRYDDWTDLQTVLDRFPRTCPALGALKHLVTFVKSKTEDDASGEYEFGTDENAGLVVAVGRQVIHPAMDCLPTRDSALDNAFVDVLVDFYAVVFGTPKVTLTPWTKTLFTNQVLMLEAVNRAYIAASGPLTRKLEAVKAGISETNKRVPDLPQRMGFKA